MSAAGVARPTEDEPMTILPQASEPHAPTQAHMIARQPVYNSQMGVYGYELLFRPEGGNRQQLQSAEATAHVLASAVIGSGLNELVYNRMAIINVTRAFLDVMPQIQLPPRQIILDIPDNLRGDDTLIDNLRRLKDMGYSLSVGGLETIRDHRLLGLADNFRVDVKKIEVGLLEKLTKFLRRYANLSLRALKIETLEEYDLYCGEGYEYFQGYFLGSPRTHRVRDLSVNRLAIMELLAAVNRTDTPVEQLEEKIVRDVSLSFKLLKLINSSFFGMPKEVDSVKRAIVLLGRDEIRKLVSLLALSGNCDRPTATIEIALLRARLCELLGQRTGSPSESFFTVGMFSALDILMEQPIHRILAKLPLSDEVRLAILRKEGPMGESLGCALAIENARWSEISFRGLDNKGLAAVYREAVQWSNEVMRHL